VGGVFINLKVVDTDICSETISSDIGRYWLKMVVLGKWKCFVVLIWK